MTYVSKPDVYGNYNATPRLLLVLLKDYIFPIYETNLYWQLS